LTLRTPQSATLFRAFPCASATLRQKHRRPSQAWQHSGGERRGQLSAENPSGAAENPENGP
ncbi:MAG: hypothetical protein AAFR56_20215, partial [Chloroflexota bacterium]